MKKFAIILNGCGSNDGSEIHESVSVMYAIDRHNASYQIFAPDQNQYQVVNHLTKEVMPEQRNCMVEAARIARGNVKELGELKAADFDALIFPGGAGSARNIFTYLLDGENFKVDGRVAQIIRDFHAARKPIGAMCISPLMIARVIEGATVTMGQDPKTSAVVEKMGGHAYPTHNGEVMHDSRNHLFSVPCYMLNARISDIFEDANCLVEAMMEELK